MTFSTFQKITAMLMAVLLMVSLAGCGSEPTAETTSEPQTSGEPQVASIRYNDLRLSLIHI